MYEVRKFYGIGDGAVGGATSGAAFGPWGAAAGAVIGAGIGAFSQGKLNKKTRRWNEKMYGWQRRDALEDWNRVNAYNSPEAVMQRYADAGLNKNLIYGNGTVTPAGEPRSASAPSWNPKESGVGDIIPQGIYAGMNQAVQTQQLDNMKTQKQVMETEILKKTADIANIGVRTDTGKYDLGMKQKLQETILQTAESNLKLINTKNQLGVADIGTRLSHLDVYNKFGMSQAAQTLANSTQSNVLRAAANARAEEQNFADLKIKAQRVINMMQDKAKTWEETIRIQEASKMIRRATTLQDLDIHLRSAGFDWKDPMVLRQLRMNSRGYSK